MVCHYWFFNHGFKYQNSVCNGCHDLLMLYDNIGDIALTVIEGVIVVLLMALANLKQFVC